MSKLYESTKITNITTIKHINSYTILAIFHEKQIEQYGVQAIENK